MGKQKLIGIYRNHDVSIRTRLQIAHTHHEESRLGVHPEQNKMVCGDGSNSAQ